jgi:hypothetical protein
MIKFGGSPEAPSSFAEQQPAKTAAPVTAGGFGFQFFLMAGLADFFVAVLGRSLGRPDLVTAVGFAADQFEEALFSSIHRVLLKGKGTKKAAARLTPAAAVTKEEKMRTVQRM